METQTKPGMIVSQTGRKFKILEVTAIKGMVMPLHYSTKEAVIIVLKGEAVLRLNEKDVDLKTNENSIIPAGNPHTLLIKEDFRARVIMEIDSEIKFVNE